MKPRIRPAAIISIYLKYVCRGMRPDGIEAFGFGNTLQEAYANWLIYDETDIPF